MLGAPGARHAYLNSARPFERESDAEGPEDARHSLIATVRTARC
jgi:hypothetical protein